MRRSKIHIALIAALATSLLFNQVALNFFHNKHDAHESYQFQSNHAQLLSHGEHCKLCSLDTLFHLYVEASPQFHICQPEAVAFAIPVLAKVIASSDFTQDRAPPFLI